MRTKIICTIFFIFFSCESIIPPETKLKVTFVDDSLRKTYDDKVTVKISKIGTGFIGEMGIRVGEDKGMTVVLDAGKYNLECSGIGNGLFSGTRTWNKTITIEQNQKFHQRFSCLKQYD